jgi:hypothetical protein
MKRADLVSTSLSILFWAFFAAACYAATYGF